jgi:hypothetical protein
MPLGSSAVRPTNGLYLFPFTPIINYRREANSILTNNLEYFLNI